MLPRSVKQSGLTEIISRKEQLGFDQLFELVNRKKELVFNFSCVHYDAFTIKKLRYFPDIATRLIQAFEKAEVELLANVSDFDGKSILCTW
jgi:hypothetical protein